MAVDVTGTTTGVTGVARYARELTSALTSAGVEVLPYAIGRGPFAAPEGTRRLGLPLRIVQKSWAIAGVPRAEHLVSKPEVVHCLDLLPTPSRRPVLMTAHDLVAVLHPDLHSAAQLSTQQGQLIGYRAAAHVLADSRSTADALVAQGVPEDRISVALLGHTALPAPAAPPVQGPYLLVVGELAARKNLPTLIRAFRRASVPFGTRLVLAGPPGFRAGETLELLGPDVLSLGRVEDAVLSALYRGATALCFPSVAEGFGLPLLEAMNAGLPIVASDLPVMREVAGDAASYVPALDVEAWSRAIEEVTGEVSRRQRLTEAGRVRAQGLTWARTAEATISAYERVLACG